MDPKFNNKSFGQIKTKFLNYLKFITIKLSYKVNKWAIGDLNPGFPCLEEIC